MELVHFFERFSINTCIGRWSWLDAVDENFAFVGADFNTVTSSSFLQSLVICWSSSSMLPNRLKSSVNRKLQIGRPIIDTDESGMPVLVKLFFRYASRSLCDGR